MYHNTSRGTVPQRRRRKCAPPLVYILSGHINYTYPWLPSPFAAYVTFSVDRASPWKGVSHSVQWRLLQILLTSPNSENLRRRKSNTIYRYLTYIFTNNNNIKFSPSSDHYKFIPPMFSTNISTPPSWNICLLVRPWFWLP